MKIAYAPSFVRQYKKLPPELQEEIKEQIEMFAYDPNHPHLKMHKLKGRLRGRSSFSINFAYRIVFQYLSKQAVILLAIGDHDVYRYFGHLALDKNKPTDYNPGSAIMLTSPQKRGKNESSAPYI